MDCKISTYIDNEMTLDEKIQFVEQIHHDKQYADEAVSLIRQEKELVALFDGVEPPTDLQMPNSSNRLKPYALSLAASILLVVAVVFGMNFFEPQSENDSMAHISDKSTPYRFVIYQQGSENVEIIGSFTDWQKTSLTPTGVEGYWEIVLQIPVGEHRYSYIIDGKKNLPDPSVAAREFDDFGTANSVISVES